MKWWDQMPWSSSSECWALSQLFHSPLSLHGAIPRLRSGAVAKNARLQQLRSSREEQSHTWVYIQNKHQLTWKDTCTLVFTAALFTTAKIWKQPKCPRTEEWINKIAYTYIQPHTHTHTHNGILLSHKKEWNFSICNMDRLGGYCAEWNK